MWILDFLAPPSCVFCGAPGEDDARKICPACHADLPWHTPAVAPTPGIFTVSITLLHYSFPVDVAIKALKFNRQLFYAPAFAELLLAASPLLPVDVDAVVPVPLHWRRKMLRGFNQADEIAGPLAGMLGVPLVRGVRRHKATAMQSGLDAAERAANVRNAFSATRHLVVSHALIVDDVITTGATVQQLARALLANGVTKVSALAVAKAD